MMRTENAKATYKTQGSVRGSCGHAHRSIRTAVECLQRDQRGCNTQGGYSDRRVVRLNGDPLSDAELNLWMDLDG